MHTYNIKPMMLARMNSEKGPMTYLVPERKPCSGTISDFGLRISDLKTKESQ